MILSFEYICLCHEYIFIHQFVCITIDLYMDICDNSFYFCVTQYFLFYIQESQTQILNLPTSPLPLLTQAFSKNVHQRMKRWVLSTSTDADLHKRVLVSQFHMNCDWNRYMPILSTCAMYMTCICGYIKNCFPAWTWMSYIVSCFFFLEFCLLEGIALFVFTVLRHNKILY